MDIVHRPITHLILTRPAWGVSLKTVLPVRSAKRSAVKMAVWSEDDPGPGQPSWGRVARVENSQLAPEWVN